MTQLKRPVSRVSAGEVYEAGRARRIVVTLRPPNVIALRAQGCRKEYCLTAETCFAMAVRAHVEAERRKKTRKK